MFVQLLVWSCVDNVLCDAQETQKTDEDLKAKVARFNDTKASLVAIERKETYVCSFIS
jgi:hypothetical protein